MYDFCLTYPYAAVLAFGGIIGFISKGSIPSLIGGLGSAAVLAACAQASLNAYHQVSNLDAFHSRANSVRSPYP